MKNWQRIPTLAVMLLLIVSLCGCSFEDIPNPLPTPEVEPTLPKPPNSPIPPTLPEKMSVDIYWDATISMQGFTKLAAGNFYRTLPDTLGEVTSSMGEVKFFRFGETVTPLEGREYRNFSNPEYYTEVITSFGNVLDSVKTENLSIVVTDLFESESDWSNVTQKLREKYFLQHQAVAIIGIKNSFSGEIFDVGLNAAQFSYDSGDDLFRFRPFYLFLMGAEPQIMEFLDNWKDKNIPCEYVVFSEYFAAQPESMRLDQTTKSSNLYADNRLKKLDNRLQEVVIKNSNEKVELTIEGNFQLYPGSCKLKNDGLKNPVKIFALDNNNAWQEQDSRGANANFDLNESGSAYNYTLTLDFNPNDTLPTGKIVLLQVQLIPSRKSVELPTWLKTWDMGNLDIAPKRLDGTKTANLQRIAESLRDSMLAVAQPVIAELDIVFDRR